MNKFYTFPSYTKTNRKSNKNKKLIIDIKLICTYNIYNIIFFKKKEENASPHLEIRHLTVQLCNYYNRKRFPSRIKKELTKANSVK